MKSLAIKMVLVSASLAASSAFGAGQQLPFELTQFDRGLATEQGATAPASAGTSATTSGGATVQSRGTGLANGAWANDHNFIAPAG